MPFVARHKTTGERIDITKIADPRGTLKRDEIVCQLCGHDMILKAGLVVRAHFAHKAACDSDYDYHPESPEHLATKSAVAEALVTNYPGYDGASVEFELVIPEIRRVADVAVSHPNGWVEVHEIQLASITTEQLKQRTEDYESIGMSVHWWLGGAAATGTNKEWCMARFGETFTLDVFKDYQRVEAA